MDVNAQGEFNVHNINLRLFEKIQREGTLILCMVTCAAFFCRKDRLFGIPLPSVLLMFGFLLVLSHLPFLRMANILEFIHYKEKGLLLLFVIFTLLAGQARWLIAAVATIALVLALSYASDVSNFHNDRMYEVQEYLFGIVCLFYAGELLRAQGQRVAFRWTPFTGLKLPATFAFRRWRFLASRFRGNDGGFRRNGEGWKDEFPRPLWLMMCTLVIAGSIGVALLAHFRSKDDAAAVEEAYQRILSGEFGDPAIRSDFDVYLNENMLIYFKESCTRADRTTRFFLHLIPADKDDLPGHRRRYGFDNLNFRYRWFDWPDTNSGGRCLVAVPLPDYVITGIETGQTTQERPSLAGEVRNQMIRDVILRRFARDAHGPESKKAGAEDDGVHGSRG